MRREELQDPVKSLNINQYYSRVNNVSGLTAILKWDLTFNVSRKKRAKNTFPNQRRDAWPHSEMAAGCRGGAANNNRIDNSNNSNGPACY